MKKKYQNFLSENFHLLVVKISVYLNRRVFVIYQVSDLTKNKITMTLPVLLTHKIDLFILLIFELGHNFSYKIAYAPSQCSG